MDWSNFNAAERIFLGCMVALVIGGTIFGTGIYLGRKLTPAAEAQPVIAEIAIKPTKTDLVLNCLNNAVANHTVEEGDKELSFTCHDAAARALFDAQAYKAGGSRETQEPIAGKSINRTLSKNGTQNCWHHVQFPDGSASDLHLCKLQINLDQFLNH
jgi:hypothetical protein